MFIGRKNHPFGPFDSNFHSIGKFSLCVAHKTCLITYTGNNSRIKFSNNHACFVCVFFIHRDNYPSLRLTAQDVSVYWIMCLINMHTSSRLWIKAETAYFQLGFDKVFWDLAVSQNIYVNHLLTKPKWNSWCIWIRCKPIAKFL